VKWGGECRVEIEVGARVVNDDQIQIEGMSNFLKVSRKILKT
jgi:hypothetical protein